MLTIPKEREPVQIERGMGASVIYEEKSNLGREGTKTRRRRDFFWGVFIFLSCFLRVFAT